MKKKVRPRARPQPSPRDRRKTSICLDADVIEEIDAEATRQGRSKSWIAQQAWLAARALMQGTPAPHKRFRDDH